MNPKPTLIIAAHGSTQTKHANQPFEKLAKSLNTKDQFAQVITAFLDGETLIETAFENLKPSVSSQVVVIPAMTSDGYYSQTVFPKKLAMNTGFDQMRTTITPAIGVQNELVEIVLQRIHSLANTHQLASDDTTVFVVGHGTRKNATSGTSTFNLADQCNIQSEFSVVPCFIDQDPEIAVVRRSVSTSNSIVIPFLMGMGPHVTDDVPESFGLVGGPSQSFPRYADTTQGQVVCDRPIGSDERITEICQSLANRALKFSQTQRVVA